MELQVNPNDRVVFLKPKQERFILSEARHPAYVAGWGTGKSMTGIGRAMRVSQEYPGNLGVIFRKEYVDLKASTMKDFRDYTGLEPTSGREVYLEDCDSTIMFLHIEELNNIQNLNLGWFLIEQAEELETDLEFFTLFGRLRRARCKHSGFIIANTRGHNWIYKLWKCGGLEKRCLELRREMPELFKGLPKDYKFSELIEANTLENKEYLSKEFLLGLEVMRKTKPKLYNRFVLNSWEDEDTVDVIILPEWVKKCAAKDVLLRPPVRRAVSIDVARFGDDATEFRAIEHGSDMYRVTAKEKHEKISTMETVGRALIFAEKHDINAFIVDEIGVGAGVVDRLIELKKEVVAVNSSEASSDPKKYKNRRAEVYANAAEIAQEGRLELMDDDEDVSEQLSWVRYKAIKSSMQLQVESKEDIKKRHLRSPDAADCTVNGLWGVTQVSVAVKSDKYSRDKSSGYRLSAETC